jgi:hypothetical protein
LPFALCASPFSSALRNRRCDSVPLTYTIADKRIVQGSFLSALVASTFTPSRNNWSSILPLILYFRYIPLGRLPWAKAESPNCSVMGAVKPSGCHKSFASKEIESRIRRIDHGVLLEPLIPDAAKWFDEMDRFNQEQFMGKRRTPRRETFK